MEFLDNNKIIDDHHSIYRRSRERRRGICMAAGLCCRCRFATIAALAVLLIMAEKSPTFAQDAGDEEPFRPGLIANLRDRQGHIASRIEHQLAFNWGDAAPDPRIARDDFQATWQGQIFVATKGDYRFAVYGSGEIELKVGGHEVLSRQSLRKSWSTSESVHLPAELQTFDLAFRATEKAAELKVFWSGPDFTLEPIPSRFLLHPREKALQSEFERGRHLARFLRCGHCHAEDRPLPAPALDQLAGNLSRAWLINWLVSSEPKTPEKEKPLASAANMSPRRMPGFGLSESEASAIADWMLLTQESKSQEPKTAPKPALAQKPTRPSTTKKRTDAEAGERLFVTLGCLACHTWKDLGASGWAGGGDLTSIADKRPTSFFTTWLTEPAKLNRDHRMPIFNLSEDERTSVELFLAAQKSPKTAVEALTPVSADRRAEGRKLVEAFRCVSCHRLSEAITAQPMLRLSAESHWDQSCVGNPDVRKHRPGFHLAAADVAAIRAYYRNRIHDDSKARSNDGQLLLTEHNCLACHAREGTREANPLASPVLSDKLAAVGRRYPDLAPLIPALTPPALNSVGDKLNDASLADAIQRRGTPHRPYLQVRMPEFRLSTDEVATLVGSLIETDRIPDRATNNMAKLDRSQQDRFEIAGGRLLSSEGFGCTSCHAVGKVQPAQAPINARGPDILEMDRRIRRPWFDRWVRNPARIVPRMEMPSVQLPVQGVLENKLDDQLAAVWHVLNVPGFEPPLPNPVRILRHHGNQPAAEPIVVTDVLRRGTNSWLKPILIGLSNRHNVLIDMESARFGLWTIGDTASQQTRGKTWFWELPGTPVFDPGITGPDLLLRAGDQTHVPQLLSQFVTEADAWETNGNTLTLNYRLRFELAKGSTVLQVTRRFSPVPEGFMQEFLVRSIPPGMQLRMQLQSERAAAKSEVSPDRRSLLLGDRFSSRIVLQKPADIQFTTDKTSIVLSPNEQGEAQAALNFHSAIPVDRFPVQTPAPESERKRQTVEIAPGFDGERLSLPFDVMPTGLSWRPNGRLVFSSLKGQVYEAIDTDHDGSADQVVILADGLPAPYGVHADTNYVDVSAKYGLMRLWNSAESGRRVETVASGWGYTEDYHDWAIGLPKTESGEYFLGIPCEQDKRSAAAARFHGQVLKLVPRQPTSADPRRYSLETVSAGHRFPTGLALDRAGELFVTDNQGNYNPFNELNHVRPGAHFGFINSLDRRKPAPTLTPPAIDIPHPWTRSVNGICFLDTPKLLREKRGSDFFGPLEGHLVGCEYDTRRLVRMTLQRIGTTYQGAAYPLSLPPSDVQRGFLGPVVCAVSPQAELFVGSLRDSGWGAGNNVGEIVRIKVQPDQLPCGIAEVRATSAGFTIDFFRPIDRQLAAAPESYNLQSYRRESTPAYGGPDLERRTEKISSVMISENGRRVTLQVPNRRLGFVYEFRLRNMAPRGGEFHPSEAFYTLRVLPE